MMNLLERHRELSINPRLDVIASLADELLYNLDKLSDNIDYMEDLVERTGSNIGYDCYYDVLNHTECLQELKELSERLSDD